MKIPYLFILCSISPVLGIDFTEAKSWSNKNINIPEKPGKVFNIKKKGINALLSFSEGVTFSSGGEISIPEGKICKLAFSGNNGGSATITISGTDEESKTTIIPGISSKLTCQSILNPIGQSINNKKFNNTKVTKVLSTKSGAPIIVKPMVGKFKVSFLFGKSLEFKNTGKGNLIIKLNIDNLT